MPTAVLDMMDRRPIWAMPEWVPAEIRAALPSDWDLVVIDEATDGSGDGSARVSASVLEAVAVAEIYFGYGIPGQLLEAGGALRWVHSGAAGVGSSLTPQMLASEVVFTNSAGIHAEPMAETVIGMILFFGRGLDLAVSNQSASAWDTNPYYRAGAPLSELSMSTVGVIGFGGIGREVARRAAGLGARVIGLKRGPVRPEDAALPALGGGGSLASRIDVVSGTEGLHRLLAESDVLVLAAPETERTRGMIDAPAFQRMKQGALLVNVARGRLVDEDALVAALTEGRLRGAGLDVFAKEPLASDHALWALPNVLVTPHVSAVTRGFWRRETRLILHDLDCFLRGAEPHEWRNRVDKGAGY